MPRSAVRACTWASILVLAVFLAPDVGGSAFAAELTSAQLCAALTASEVAAVTGNERKAIPHKVVGCKYQNPTAPNIYLKNSPAKTEEQYIEGAKRLEGVVRKEAGGVVLVSYAFDIKKGKISEAWFELRGTPVQMGFGGGLEQEKVLALVRAARD